MKLDFFTLFVAMGFANFIIVIILIYYQITTNSKKWFFKTYLAYKILETFALIGFGLRNIAPDVISVLIANIIYFIHTYLHLISVGSFKGELDKRFAYTTGIITLSCIMLYVLNINDTPSRVFISSSIVAINYLYAAFYLIKIHKPYKLPILMASVFFIFAASNLIRGSFVLGIENYRFTDLTTIDLIFTFSGIVVILAGTIGFLLMLREVDESIIFRQNKINKVAIDQSPVSIVITDTNGAIEYVNPKFSSLTGYNLNEVVGKNPNVLRTDLTPAATFRDLWETIKSGKVWQGEFINKKRNDEIYYEEAIISPIVDEKQKIISYLAIKTDITERKKHEELIKARNEELVELNATKDRLFSIIAHDLKGPIGNLQQLLEIADYDLSHGDKSNVEEILRLLKNTAKTSFVLLENLLAWSRSQLNAVTVRPDFFNLTDAVEEAVNLMAAAINAKKITLEKDYQPINMAYADKSMIDTVMRNLLSNAIKFTPKNGMIKIRVNENENETLLKITDTGVGIHPHRLEKLFVFSENQSTKGTAGEKGTGLGLVLSREFILKNQGRIWVESEVDKGSTFFFALPTNNPKK